jgi:hypothetical protein
VKPPKHHYPSPVSPRQGFLLARFPSAAGRAASLVRKRTKCAIGRLLSLSYNSIVRVIPSCGAPSRIGRVAPIMESLLYVVCMGAVAVVIFGALALL